MKKVLLLLLFASVAYSQDLNLQGKKLAAILKTDQFHCMPVERLDGSFTVRLSNIEVESDLEFSKTPLKVSDLVFHSDKEFSLSFHNDTINYRLDFGIAGLGRYSPELGGIDARDMDLFTLHYSGQKEGIAPVYCYIRN